MKKEPLGKELADLEKSDPKVKAAAQRYDEMVQKVTQGRSHAIPCTIEGCEWHTPEAAQ